MAAAAPHGVAAECLPRAEHRAVSAFLSATGWRAGDAALLPPAVAAACRAASELGTRCGTRHVAASVAAALVAAQRGAAVVRVHDVAATVDAIRVWRAASAG